VPSVYWAVSPSSIRGVLDQIRTTLASLVAELAARMPEDDELPVDELDYLADRLERVYAKAVVYPMCTSDSAPLVLERKEPAQWAGPSPGWGDSNSCLPGWVTPDLDGALAFTSSGVVYDEVRERRPVGR
jgi:hypothetical protein